MKVVARQVGSRLLVCLAIAALAFVLSSDLRNAVLTLLAESRTSAPPVSEPIERHGGDWPHLRGPIFDGSCDETGLADRWPDEGPPVLWTREIGRGYSAVIAVGERLFTQTQGLYRQSVLCLDAESGRTVWRHDYAWPYGSGGMYPGPRATPTWHDGHIYFVGPRGVLGCLRASDGSPLWSVDLEEKFGCRGMDFGYSASPLVEDGKVIVPVGAESASLVALDAGDGTVVWTGGDQAASYCGAAPITFEGRRLLLVFLQNGLALHDPLDGRVVWQTSYSQGYDEHAAMPIYHDGRVMVACPFRSGSWLYRLQRVKHSDKKHSDKKHSDKKHSDKEHSDKIEAREVWQSRHMSNDVVSSVLVDGCVYGFDLRDIQTKARRPSRGTFRAIDFATGKTFWTSDLPGHAATIAADGKLFMLNDRGEAILAAAEKSEYRELGRAEIFADEICWTTPTLSRGRLYLRSPTRLACLYVGMPENLSKSRRAGASRAASIKGRGRLDLNWAVGGEREYPFDPPDRKELSLWFRYTLWGIFLPVSVLAVLLGIVAGLIPRQRQESCISPTAKTTARRISRAVFWIGLAVGGAIGTPLFNRFDARFVFTWPLVLFVAQQAAITAIVASARTNGRARAGRLGVAAVIMFFAVCLLYFDLCQRLDLAMQWVFLIGFLPSWPVVVPASYLLRRDGRIGRDIVIALAGFAVYFWSCGAFIAWRLGDLWSY